MSNIMTAFTQQYSRKVSLLSQQTGKKNGKKVQRRQSNTRKKSKKY
tara:strand:+ start:611 stop:748 length:138 start_codon:yes stop_codon:yes gene_type:complete